MQIFGLKFRDHYTGLPIAASTIGNNILFQGHALDFDLNLYDFRNRWYDPAIGRFTTIDSFGYQDSMNLYQGMNMNPGNYLDPMGMWWLTVHTEITSAAWENFIERKGGWYGMQNLGISWLIDEVSKFVDWGKFDETLQNYSMWPDIPETVIGTVIAAAQHTTGYESERLSYQTHYGNKSYWHSMRKGNQSSEQVKSLMMHDIGRWTKTARVLMNEVRNGKSESGKTLSYLEIRRRAQKAANFLGMAIHLVEDSYCPDHSQRDKKSGKITEFWDYSTQKSHYDFVKGNEEYFDLAVDAVTDIFEMFFKSVSFGDLGDNNIYTGFWFRIRTYISENVLALE